MDSAVVGDVVAVVAARAGVERQQPQGIDAQRSNVVESLDQTGEVADAVVVRVEEGLEVQLVDDRVLVPERVVAEGTLGWSGPGRVRVRGLDDCVQNGGPYG
jgi:hypothetical protein